MGIPDALKTMMSYENSKYFLSSHKFALQGNIYIHLEDNRLRTIRILYSVMLNLNVQYHPLLCTPNDPTR